MRTPGRSLELFYVNGHADGMLTAELYTTGETHKEWKMRDLAAPEPFLPGEDA